MDRQKIKLSRQYIKYLAAGSFFTIAGPFLFILLSLYIDIRIASIVNELFIHLIRYLSYKYFVFTNVKATPIAYIGSIAPMVILNIFLVFKLKDTFTVNQIAIITVLFSISLGYIWTKYCFKKIY